MEAPLKKRDWLRKAIVQAGGFDAVAEASGVSIKHLHNLCNGHRHPRPPIVARLRPVLSVSDLQWWDDMMTVSAVNPQARGEAAGSPLVEESADA